MARLPDDPAKWVPPPADVAQARQFRDRLMVGFSEVTSNIYSDLSRDLSVVDAWNADFLRRQMQAMGTDYRQY